MMTLRLRSAWLLLFLLVMASAAHAEKKTYNPSSSGTIAVGDTMTVTIGRTVDCYDMELTITGECDSLVVEILGSWDSGSNYFVLSTTQIDSTDGTNALLYWKPLTTVGVGGKSDLRMAPAPLMKVYLINNDSAAGASGIDVIPRCDE